jgi:1-pyrroline-5-carboxylate dehydrogenase
MSEKIKITYATMSADNEELQAAMDEAIATVREEWLGVEVPLIINGEKVYTQQKLERYSPINTDLLLCTAQNGTADHAKAAISAAKAAFLDWRAMPWPERVAIIRAAAERMRAQNFALSTLLIFEVGKNRLEALGEVEETVDLLYYYADSMEKNNGFVNEMGRLNPADEQERNYSILRPHGAWVVISPFNFPMALSAAPIAAALVTGNTVVFKGSPETPYTSGKVAELFVEAGLPPGVFNSVFGPDEVVGQELLDNPAVDGWTFTGSYPVGMKVLRSATSGPAGP